MNKRVRGAGQPALTPADSERLGSSRRSDPFEVNDEHSTMSSQHTTMETTIKTAGVTQANSLASAEQTRQATIDAASHIVGFHPGTGTAGQYATYMAAVASAIKQLGIDRASAEMAKQTSMAVARDVMRNANTGEIS